MTWMDSSLKLFSNAQELLKQTPVQANNRDELRQLLAERESWWHHLYHGTKVRITGR